MQLHLDCRPVGDVLVIQCKGRIVLGKEVLTLHHLVGNSLTRYADIVLQFDQVEYVDNTGLGALVRLVQMARSKGGDMKISGLPANLAKTLATTNLLSQFEIYDSVEEAIAAACLGARYCRGNGQNTRPLVLCVYDSIDMCTFLREVFCRAGYNVLTVGNVSDARVLLKATKAKFVVLSGHLQGSHGQPARRVIEETDPNISLLVLDDSFASQDPGEAANKLLSAVSAMQAKPA
jgi:anti-sigma B factor antagonist